MDTLTDFVAQMHSAVLDEMSLFELPRGSVDRLPGADVDHGPWPTTNCAAVIRAWLRGGWLHLYYRDPPPGWRIMTPGWRHRVDRAGVLAGVDAEDILSRPEWWTVDRAEGHVLLCPTAWGTQRSWLDWRDHVLDLARSLPLT